MVLFPGSELMNVALTKVIDLSATGLSTYGSAVETYEDNFDDDPTQALAHMLECFGSVLLLIGAIHSWPDMNIEYFAMACCSLAPVLYMLATHHTKHMKKQENNLLFHLFFIQLPFFLLSSASLLPFCLSDIWIHLNGLGTQQGCLSETLRDSPKLPPRDKRN